MSGWHKIVVSAAWGLSSMLISTLGFLIGGTMVGGIVNPHEHHEYACACDESPYLTVGQTWGYAAVFILIMMAISWVIIRRLRLSKEQSLIAFLVLAGINIFCAISLAPILYTQVTG